VWPLLDERTRRPIAASEAQALGYGVHDELIPLFTLPSLYGLAGSFSQAHR